ncbi:hypothetical protein J6590_027947 [Homalodisca vitripennis]|nr:hypothetical protein J6590_027947 [Homalodisca vitripennis]
MGIIRPQKYFAPRRKRRRLNWSGKRRKRNRRAGGIISFGKTDESDTFCDKCNNSRDPCAKCVFEVSMDSLGLRYFEEEEDTPKYYNFLGPDMDFELYFQTSLIENKVYYVQIEDEMWDLAFGYYCLQRANNAEKKRADGRFAIPNIQDLAAQRSAPRSRHASCLSTVGYFHIIPLARRSSAPVIRKAKEPLQNSRSRLERDDKICIFKAPPLPRPAAAVFPQNEKELIPDSAE